MTNVIALNADKSGNLNDDLLTELKVKTARGIPFTLQEVVGIMDKSANYSKVTDYLVECKLTTKAQFERAVKHSLHREYIVTQLGFYPDSPQAFVTGFATGEKVRVRFTGDLQREAPVVYHDKAGGEYIITPEERAKSRAVDNYARMVENQAFNKADFERECRIKRDNLKLEIKDTQIADAVDKWLEDEKHKCLMDIMTPVFYERGLATGPVGQAMWRKLEAAAFTTAPDDYDVDWERLIMPAGYAVAVLRKYMWQVKRKVLGLPITNHLMPIISGKSGGGKSTFVKMMNEPIIDAVRAVAFDQITDDRNIDIWKYPVMFIDEMRGAGRVDVATLKHAITAENVVRRVMRTNGTVNVRQMSTFIACTDSSLSEQIKDDASSRRFAELGFRSRADWAALNEIDWTLMWQSVDEHGDDPTLAFQDSLKVQQELNRTKNPVEEWARSLGHSLSMPTYARECYNVYKTWEENYSSISRLTQQVFFMRMNRIIRNQPETGWCSDRNKHGMRYWYDKSNDEAVKPRTI